MSTRQTFAYEITGRARRLGWPVELAGNGIWKIKCPAYHNPKTDEDVEPRTVQVHLTPSDVNAEKTIMRELDRHGFTDAEAEWVRQDEASRRTKLAFIAAENQRIMDKAQQHADAVARAAGETRVNWDLILQPYPVPKTFERVNITPELAEELLKLNTKNRPKREKEIQFWASLINAGEWRYTHQGVAVDVNGALQDGQHRLSGIVRAGVPVQMQISIGMPVENYAAIDNGLKRTFGDVVAGRGFGNHNRVGTAARLVILYNDYPRRPWSAKVPGAEVDTFIMQPFDPIDSDDKRLNGDLLHLASNQAQLMWRSCRINASAATAGTFKLYEHLGEDHPKVVEFTEGLKDGANMPTDDARFVLRRYCLVPGKKNNRVAHAHLALFIKAWNKFIIGARVGSLSIRSNEDMPDFQVPVTE